MKQIIIALLLACTACGDDDAIPDVGIDAADAAPMRSCTPSGLFCEAGELCIRGGRCDGPGECITPSESCEFPVDPVCGCDGMTYPNTCQANRARVDTRFDASACE